jgi:hypothetical protein
MSRAGVRRGLLLGALLASLALVAPASSSVRIERPTHVGGTLQVSRRLGCIVFAPGIGALDFAAACIK